MPGLVSGLAFLGPGIMEILKDGQWHKHREFVSLSARIPSEIAVRRLQSRHKDKIERPIATKVEIGRDYILRKWFYSHKERGKVEVRNISEESEYRFVGNMPEPVCIASSEESGDQPKKRRQKHNPRLRELVIQLLQELRGGKIPLILHVTNDCKILLEMQE